MVDPKDTATKTLQGLAPPGPTGSASARLAAARYVIPKARGGCRNCKHRASNTDRPYCALFRAPVELGGVCSRAALA